MYQVIYLTGPPAMGKSTVVDYLTQHLSPLIPFVYSRVLSDHIASQKGSTVAQEELRQQSEQIVTPEDVAAVDARLLGLVQTERDNSHIIIDSHAVTKESYGFRVTPFSLNTLAQIQPTRLFCLYAPSSVAIDRILSNNQGRPTPSEFEADFHTYAQANVALIYGIHLGIPIYFIDAEQPTDVIASKIMRSL